MVHISWNEASFCGVQYFPLCPYRISQQGVFSVNSRRILKLPGGKAPFSGAISSRNELKCQLKTLLEIQDGRVCVFRPFDSSMSVYNTQGK